MALLSLWNHQRIHREANLTSTSDDPHPSLEKYIILQAIQTCENSDRNSDSVLHSPNDLKPGKKHGLKLNSTALTKKLKKCKPEYELTKLDSLEKDAFEKINKENYQGPADPNEDELSKIQKKQEEANCKLERLNSKQETRENSLPQSSSTCWTEENKQSYCQPSRDKCQPV